jgi:hypothetical protein
MANGSILIVGGEIASNAAEQPTLEILPATGVPGTYPLDLLLVLDRRNAWKASSLRYFSAHKILLWKTLIR